MRTPESTLEYASKCKFVGDLESLLVFLEKKIDKLSFLSSLPPFLPFHCLNPSLLFFSCFLSILQQLHSRPHPCLAWERMNQGAQESVHLISHV